MRIDDLQLRKWEEVAKSYMDFRVDSLDLANIIHELIFEIRNLWNEIADLKVQRDNWTTRAGAQENAFNDACVKLDAQDNEIERLVKMCDELKETIKHNIREKVQLKKELEKYENPI